MGRIYLIASLGAHAALLALLYYFGTYEPAIAAQERQLDAGRLLDSHAAMRKRVADMEEIKALMRESESAGAAGEGTPGTVRFDATTTEAPDELLALAEALSKEIDAMGERARADAYGRLAGVDRDQAEAQLAAPEPPGAPAQDKPAAAEVQASTTQEPTTREPAQGQASASNSPQGPAPQAAQESGQPGDGAGAGAEARIAALEQRARDVLAQRQRQMEGAQQGVQVGGGLSSGAAQKGLSARIAAFIKGSGGTSPFNSGSGRYWGNDGDMFDRGPSHIPAVDLAAMRKGSGRKLGAGGEFANRVYVNSWYLIGPFAGKHGRDMFATDRYPPEQAVVLDAAYRGKDGRFLTWRYMESPTYPLEPPDMAEDSVYYGYTELMMDSERDLVMWIGADDDVQVWINDRLEWKGGNVNKLGFFRQVYESGNDYKQPYNLNEGKVTVHFRKGRNKLFFKLSNGPNKAFLSMVLTPA